MATLLSLEALDGIERLRVAKRVRLVTTEGDVQGLVHMEQDPDALAAEIIRLARVGAMAEHAALVGDDAPVSTIVARARRRAGDAVLPAAFR
jgi:hypothetical protein